MSVTEEGILKPKTFTFEWKIKGFFANCQKSGDRYKSPQFPIQYPKKGVKWYLVVFPRGNHETNKDYVALCLAFESENEIKVTVDFEISIVVSNKNSVSTRKKTTHTFIRLSPPEQWGWLKFIDRNAIKDPGIGALVDDTLTVLCEITFHPPDEDDKEICDYDEWLDEIGNGFDDYEKLFESGNFSDVTFNVPDKKINLHKNILSCRSPVFEAMFEHDMKENRQNSVDITDIDYGIMKELFRFLYSGKVKNIEKIASELLIAADKYQITELKALCEKTLYDKLTVDNAVEYLKLTELCDTIKLKPLVIKFVAAHQKEVAKKAEFADLNKDVMYQIFLAAAEKD